MRRRVAVLLTALACVAPLVTEEAGARKTAPRTVVETYRYLEGCCIVISPTEGAISAASVTLVPQPHERQVSLEIADASGLPVKARVVQDGAVSRWFCGETGPPVEFRPRKELEVYFYSGPCEGGPAVATSGTVTATFE